MRALRNLRSRYVCERLDNKLERVRRIPFESYGLVENFKRDLVEGQLRSPPLRTFTLRAPRSKRPNFSIEVLKCFALITLHCYINGLFGLQSSLFLLLARRLCSVLKGVK